MRNTLRWGGFASAAILLAVGLVSIALGLSGRATVRHELNQQQIVGTSDMSPKAIAAEAKEAGLKGVSLPTCTVANLPVNNGSRARCFAEYMRIHSFEHTGGLVYSQMGMFVAKSGTPKAQLTPDGATDNAQYAAIDPATKAPLANHARDIWVTETALTTALNTSFLAEQIGLFSIVVGISLLLAGGGFGILAWKLLR